MNMDNIVTDERGYLVDGATGEPVVFYVCDPAKNTACDKRMCRSSGGTEDEGEFGFCASTPDPACRKEGSRAFYKRLNDQGYFGREYVEEANA